LVAGRDAKTSFKEPSLRLVGLWPDGCVFCMKL
jgi:hypothetical protein